MKPNPEHLAEAGVIKDYRYRREAALLFKNGVFHNTNDLPCVHEPRWMLCMHLGVYSEKRLRLDKLQAHGFHMPVALEARTSIPAALRWQEDYKIKIDKNGKMDWPAKKK